MYDHVKKSQIKRNHEYTKRSIQNKSTKKVYDAPKCITDKVETHSLQGFGNYAKLYMVRVI